MRELEQSVQRAGVPLRLGGELSTTKVGVRVSLPLAERLHPQGERAVKEYIRAFAKTCGWTAREVTIRPRQVVFVASSDAAPAASSS